MAYIQTFGNNKKKTLKISNKKKKMIFFLENVQVEKFQITK